MKRTQRISGPVALAVVIVTVLILAVFFSNPELAPPQDTDPELPPELPIGTQTAAAAREGAAPLGVTVLMPPLPEDRGRGVRIAEVDPNGPAGRAGMKAGDLITEIGGKGVGSPVGLSAAVSAATPDKELRIVVLRAKDTHTLVVTGVAGLPPEERVGP